MLLRALLVILTSMYCSLTWAAAPPPLGKTIEIPFASAKHGKHFVYEFQLQFVQGDRFRFQVSAKNGADTSFNVALNEIHRVTVFEQSGWQPKLDWTMKKIPPGNIINVRILTPSPGQAYLCVTNANAVGQPGNLQPPNAEAALRVELDKLRAELEKQSKALDDLREENARLKQALGASGTNRPDDNSRPSTTTPIVK